MRCSGLCVLGFLVGVIGCAAESADAPPDEIAQGGGAGQTSGTGGTKGTGGATAAGGTKATGGAKGTGGAASTGGAKGTGGSTGTGGATGSGGATGTGGATGSGGSGGGPPHVVGACDGLGAVDHFEDITPPGVSGGVLRVVVDQVNTGTLYAGTEKQGLRKSIDCGATWTKANTGRNAGVLDSGSLWFVLVDPVDPSLIFAAALYGSDPSLFKSTNGGIDWDSVFPPGSEVADTVEYNFFQWGSMDPTDHRHLVTTFHAACKGAYAPSCMAETKDSGAAWRLFKTPTGGWMEAAGPVVIGPTTWLLLTLMDGVYYTKDSGATSEKVAPGGGTDIYHAADGTYYLTSLFGIWRSPDAHTWTSISGSPSGTALTGDGKRMFNSIRDGSGQPYWTAPEGDGAKWTTLASPNMPHGAVYFGYEADHHVLYSANTSSGLWRVVTQ
jgi:hypothetical protein